MVRALAVEQLQQLPLLRAETKEEFGSRHFRENDVLALLDVFLVDDARVQPGIAALCCGCRKVGQRYLESFEDIHFGFVNLVTSSC